MKKKYLVITIFIITVLTLSLIYSFPRYMIFGLIFVLSLSIFHIIIDFIIIDKNKFNENSERINSEEIDKFISKKFYRILINKENKIYYVSRKTREELDLQVFDPINKYIPDRISQTQLKEIKVDISGNKYMYYRIFNSVYLWPISEQEKYKKLYQESVNGIGYLYLDNLNEISLGHSEVKKYEILSQYYSYVENMFDKYNVIGKRIGTSKYFFVSTIGSYRQIKNDNFEILKQISMISNNNEQLSASLGFALTSNEKNFDEVDEKAQDCVNLALERGGDQVVELINGELKYIGGKTATSSNRSKVRVRVFAKELNERITKSEEIVLFGHHNLDMDCFASLITLAKYIDSKYENKKISINASLQSSSYDVKNAYDTLDDEEKKYFRKFPEIKKDSLSIVVDASSSKVIYDVSDLIKSENIMIIDHHIRLDDDVLKRKSGLVDVSASSTSEIICDILNFNNYLKSVDRKFLTMLYSAIIIDTNNLSQKTTSKTFDALSLLSKYGASIKESLDLRQDTLDFIQEKNEVISNVEKYRDKYGISYSPYIWTDTKIAKAANDILLIKDFEVSFVISKTKSGIKVSARSSNDVHVGNIMSNLGGGGHATIAACLFSYDEKNVIEKIKYAIDNTIKE